MNFKNIVNLKEPNQHFFYSRGRDIDPSLTEPLLISTVTQSIALYYYFNLLQNGTLQPLFSVLHRGV